MSQGEYEKKRLLREQNADKKKQRFITFARICSFLLMLSVFVCVLFDSIKKVWYIPILMVMIVTLFAAVWQKKWEKKLFIPLIVATFVLQLFAAYWLEISYNTADLHMVTRNALRIVNHQAIDRDYFARYPNNLGILLIFSGILRVSQLLFSSLSFRWLTAVNVISIDVAIVFCIAAVKLIAGKTAASRMAMFVLIFAPLYLYIPISYTDTYSMPYLSAACYLILKLGKNWRQWSPKRRTGYACLFGMVAWTGYTIKGSLIIVLVAFAIYVFLRYHAREYWKMMVWAFLTFFVCQLTFSTVLDGVQLISQKDYDRYKFPTAHWIMMGLSGSGGYNGKDASFTASFQTYEKRQAAVSKELRSRIQNMGLKGVAKQFYKKAARNGWNSGTMSAERFIGDEKDQPVRRNWIHEVILSKGNLHTIWYAVTQAIWLIFFGLCTMGLLLKNKNSLAGNNDLFLLQMLLIGFMVFFMIWETKPRYILHFSLLVLSMASISFETICDWLMKNRRCLREKITDDLHSHFHSARNRWNRIMEFYDRWT